MKRRRVTVRWSDRWLAWVMSYVHESAIYGRETEPRIYRATTKAEAVFAGRVACGALGPPLPDGQRAQLIIFGKNGRIQEERTYPRSSDPRRTKG